MLTNTGGEVAALVQEAEAGLSVAASQLAAGVRELASADDAQRARWGGSGKEFIGRRRSRTALANRLERVLDGLAAG